MRGFLGRHKSHTGSIIFQQPALPQVLPASPPPAMKEPRVESSHLIFPDGSGKPLYAGDIPEYFDPDMLTDPLPEPFGFVNEVLEGMIEAAWVDIIEADSARRRMEREDNQRRNNRACLPSSDTRRWKLGAIQLIASLDDPCISCVSNSDGVVSVYASSADEGQMSGIREDNGEDGGPLSPTMELAGCSEVHSDGVAALAVARGVLDLSKEPDVKVPGGKVRGKTPSSGRERELAAGRGRSLGEESETTPSENRAFLHTQRQKRRTQGNVGEATPFVLVASGPRVHVYAMQIGTHGQWTMARCGTVRYPARVVGIHVPGREHLAGVRDDALLEVVSISVDNGRVYVHDWSSLSAMTPEVPREPEGKPPKTPTTSTKPKQSKAARGGKRPASETSQRSTGSESSINEDKRGPNNDLPLEHSLLFVCRYPHPVRTPEKEAVPRPDGKSRLKSPVEKRGVKSDKERGGKGRKTRRKSILVAEEVQEEATPDDGEVPVPPPMVQYAFSSAGVCRVLVCWRGTCQVLKYELDTPAAPQEHDLSSESTEGQAPTQPPRNGRAGGKLARSVERAAGDAGGSVVEGQEGHAHHVWDLPFEVTALAAGRGGAHHLVAIGLANGLIVLMDSVLGIQCAVYPAHRHAISHLAVVVFGSKCLMVSAGLGLILVHDLDLPSHQGLLHSIECDEFGKLGLAEARHVTSLQISGTSSYPLMVVGCEAAHMRVYCLATAAEVGNLCPCPAPSPSTSSWVYRRGAQWCASGPSSLAYIVRAVEAPPTSELLVDSTDDEAGDMSGSGSGAFCSPPALPVGAPRPGVGLSLEVPTISVQADPNPTPKVEPKPRRFKRSHQLQIPLPVKKKRKNTRRGPRWPLRLPTASAPSSPKSDEKAGAKEKTPEIVHEGSEAPDEASLDGDNDGMEYDFGGEDNPYASCACAIAVYRVQDVLRDLQPCDEDVEAREDAEDIVHDVSSSYLEHSFTMEEVTRGPPLTPGPPLASPGPRSHTAIGGMEVMDRVSSRLKLRAASRADRNDRTRRRLAELTSDRSQEKTRSRSTAPLGRRRHVRG